MLGNRISFTLVLAAAICSPTAFAQPDFSATRPKVDKRILDPLPEEKPVVPAKNRFPANNEIDRFITAAWAKYNVSPRGLCSEDEFLRRVYLDVTGMIPTAEQVQAYSKSTARNRRAKLIDQLLESPRYADHWAV